uniref:Uncharacterized protein n=1 Tax=Romanomermis culicivorax TaxID=13658 RepID=A0A915LAD0_ROMCU
MFIIVRRLTFSGETQPFRLDACLLQIKQREYIHDSFLIPLKSDGIINFLCITSSLHVNLRVRFTCPNPRAVKQ